MEYGNPNPEQEYVAPPLPRPDLGPHDVENQLHGAAYDAAVAEVERLGARQAQLIDELNMASCSIEASMGYPQQITPLIATPEGYAEKHLDYQILEADQIEGLEVEIEQKDQELKQLARPMMAIGARLWQESGTRLFADIEAGNISPRAAINRYYGVWDVYSPDRFYEACGVSHDECVAMMKSVFAGYAVESFQARQLPDNMIEEDYIRMVEHLAADLGISTAEYGL